MYGPTAEGEPPVLPPLVETFKVMAYCDDVKPTISSLDEFEDADRGANLFEKSAGTKLHRDPTSNKCKFLPLGKWRRELAQEDIPTEYMRLTETLDMVGVQLCATRGQTRMKNGNILRDKVSKICGSWKAGKFMPFTARPFSANSFSLSKVWFRCHKVNIRQSDINSIHSSVKRWLYADMIIKPEEKVLFRSVKLGGLGLVHAKFKAQACFLKTFFDLSANPKYIPSLFQTTVFRAYVLKENENYPALPPYYDELFFKNIEAAKTAQLHVETMSVKQWYQFLLDQEYTELDQLDQQRRHIPSKAELLFPASDWNLIWRNCRLPCLDSQMSSLSFKLIHNLLPSESRLSSTLRKTSPFCTHNCPADTTSDYLHIFFNCSLSHKLGGWLMRVVRTVDPTATHETVLRLETAGGDSLVWFILSALRFIWDQRSKKKKASIQDFTALCQSDLNILSDTRHLNIAMLAQQLLSL